MAHHQCQSMWEGKSSLKPPNTLMHRLPRYESSSMNINGSLMGTYSDTVTNERPTIATPVTVHDISSEEDKYTLSSHGFQLIHHQSNEKEFRDEKKIKEEYYQECEQLILDM